MSYVQRVLQPGEQVRHVSSIHWIVYWPGVAVALLAVVAFWLSDTRLLPGLWRYEPARRPLSNCHELRS